MRQFNIFTVFLILLVISPKMSAQLNDAEKYLTLVKGQVYTDTINSLFPVSNVTPLVQNVTVQTSAIPGMPKKYKVTITPNPVNLVGYGKASIQYTEGTASQAKVRWMTYHLAYVESKITTAEDVVSFDTGQEAGVNPLLNDNSTTSGLTLTGLAKIQGGTAIINQDSVIFTPDELTDHGYVLYSVKDSLGSTASGMIHFVRNQDVIAAQDTLQFTLLNTRKQLVTMASTGFTVATNPSKGGLTAIHDMVFSYTPNTGATGNDVFSFEDANNHKRIVMIKLVSKVPNNSSVRDDKFYTPKNTSITFNVFENDLSSNFPITNFSTDLVHDTLGIFTYTPASGFSGIKNFTYTVNYGYYQATGKIAIAVGNYQPLLTNDYSFNTIKNKALVLEYDVPVNGYQFNLLNNPQYGAVEIFSNSNLTEDCNTFYSKSTLIYTPDANYYGQDSFDVEYCVVNNPCVVYKINVNVFDSALDTLCPCAGPDCVWSGDMNGDGRVSVSDILSLGRFIGLSGSARSVNVYPFYTGQHGEDWNYSQPNGLNIKHVDANGDGIITESDTLSVSNYYAGIHRFVPEEVLAIKDYNFELIPNSTELDSGDLLVLDVVIGTNNKPVIDIFGLAFGLNVAPSLIDSASFSASFDKNSWFTSNSPSLQMAKQPKEGVLHLAFTRTSGIVEDEIEGFRPVGASGNGIIGKIIFIVEDEIEGFKTKDNYIIRRISTNGIEMEDAEGEKFLLPDTYIDVKINLEKKTPVPSEDKLVVFPNPAKDVVNLHFNGKNLIKGVKVFDQQGLMVDSNLNLSQASYAVNTSSYPNGIYIFQVVTTDGVITKKVSVLTK